MLERARQEQEVRDRNRQHVSYPHSSVHLPGTRGCTHRCSPHLCPGGTSLSCHRCGSHHSRDSLVQGPSPLCTYRKQKRVQSECHREDEGRKEGDRRPCYGMNPKLRWTTCISGLTSTASLCLLCMILHVIICNCVCALAVF